MNAQGNDAAINYNTMGSSPKIDKPEPPKPVPAKAKLTEVEDEGTASNFEEEIKRRRRKQQTTSAGETGGYGGSTKLG